MRVRKKLMQLSRENRAQADAIADLERRNAQLKADLYLARYDLQRERGKTKRPPAERGDLLVRITQSW